jgi:hypothetical protein
MDIFAEEEEEVRVQQAHLLERLVAADVRVDAPALRRREGGGGRRRARR